jgi:hypothetical protein
VSALDDGATPERQDGSDDCGGSKGRKHAWSWRWDGPSWTDEKRCTVCGRQEAVPFPPQKPREPGRADPTPR